jgi:iron complex outermembrane receptor protein
VRITFAPENNPEKQMNTLKKILPCLLLLCTLTTWAQDRATIKGTITLSDNSAAENISVELKGTNNGALTNAQGNYEIRNIRPGSYTLIVSAVGIAPLTETITLAAGENVTRNITLSENQQQLNEVIIEANTNKYARTKSEIVSKMPLKDIENPQVYNTITSEVLREQVITNFDDALKNAPGLDKLWESTGRGTDGAGYFSLRGFAVQPTMINGVPGLTNGSPDPANIESIDVIKGPSGTLFGSSLISYGGLINVTTKKPYNTFGGNVSYTGGTYGLNRYVLDINTPLGTDKKVNARVNAAYHTEDSFQDAGFKKSIFVAPSITYQANEKLSFFANAEFFNGKSTNQTMLFLDRSAPLRVRTMKELGYNNKRSYTSNDLYTETPSVNLQAQMNYKINNNWTSQTILSRSSAKALGYYSYLYEATSTIEAQTGLVFEKGIILRRSTTKQNSETIGTDIQQNFIGEFNIGSVKNKFVAGLDYFNRNIKTNNTGYGVQGFVNIGVDPGIFASIAPALHTVLNIPLGGTGDDTGVLTQAGADAGIAASSSPSVGYSLAKQEVFSAYASEIAYILPNLSAMASLRVDRFSNDNGAQTAFSPKFGLVFQPILNQLSIFANYMDGFVNTDPAQNSSGSNPPVAVTFDPEHANQFEVGTKINLFNNKVSGSLSYYHTKVDNMVYTLYGPTQADPGNIANSVQGGAQTNKGIEFSITANPVAGLNIIAGYSYNDSRLTAGDPDFVGHRPESAGPQNLANLWATYKFNRGLLNGFGLGFGGNYGSENKIMSREIAGTFALPEYTVINASAFYNIEAFTLTLKMDNITNKEYYKGWSTINPQRPRIFAANLTYNF